MPTSYTQYPDPREHGPYFERYVHLIPPTDIIHRLASQFEETRMVLDRISESQASFRYGPDKWSIKEVVGHLMDTERVFAYRALCFSRNETQALPGFEQNDYVEAGAFDHRPFTDLVDEFHTVRQATLSLFRGLSAEMMERTGTASGMTLSVRALAYLVAGHERHHLNLLQERYRINANA